jgi:hypothetical protein
VLSRPVVTLASLLLVVLAGCGYGDTGDVDAVAAPALGACRDLDPEDLAAPSDATQPVDCSEDHTAETFVVRDLPKKVASLDDPSDPRLAAHVYETCDQRFRTFLDGDESTVMRSMLTWVWFRPSDQAWQQGARWYRCDVIGGGQQSAELLPLPKTARGLFQFKTPDKWMSCVNGDSVDGAVKIPCSEPHNWRAVTTIKLGGPKDKFPGNRVVRVKTRDFCSGSVHAWLNYPAEYDFGYTFFSRPEWKAGNRRSICWAKTDE